jgi:hypothetical protein
MKTKDKRQKTKDKGWGGDLCLSSFAFCLLSSAARDWPAAGERSRTQLATAQ